jgi:hypothetical protein
MTHGPLSVASLFVLVALAGCAAAPQALSERLPAGETRLLQA